MPPFSPQITSNFDSEEGLKEINNNVIIATNPKIKCKKVTESEDNCNSRSFIIKTYNKENVRYIYNTSGQTIVWRNVFLFFALHMIYLYSYYVCLVYKCWYTWIFGMST